MAEQKSDYLKLNIITKTSKVLISTIMDNFDLIEKAIKAISDKIDGLQLQDIKIDCVEDKKKLSEILKSVMARKGEILPQDIKGNTYKALTTYLTLSGENNLQVSWINEEGKNGTYYVDLSDKFANKDKTEKGIKTNQNNIQSAKTDISSILTEVKYTTAELKKYNDRIEKLI